MFFNILFEVQGGGGGCNCTIKKQFENNRKPLSRNIPVFTKKTTGKIKNKKITSPTHQQETKRNKKKLSFRFSIGARPIRSYEVDQS